MKLTCDLKYELARVLKLLVLVALLFSPVAIFISIRMGVFDSYKQHYAVVIDAGSVHTTLQLYQYPTQNPYNSTIGSVDQVLSCEISGDIGISSLSRPEYVKDLIYSGNCWEKVSNYTNDDFKVNETSNFIGGTSGMRQLKISSPKKAKRTINYLNQELKRKFPVNSNAWILSNSDEGKYGWLSTNYLLHGKDIRLDNQVGSLDWGGGSAEITYATLESSVDQVKIFNQSINIFTRSDECYGQRQGLMRYYTLLILDNFERSLNLDSQIEAPCQPKASEFSITSREILASKCAELKVPSQKKKSMLSSRKYWHFTGTSNHSQCQRITERLFDHHECKSTFKSNCFKQFSFQEFKPKEFYAFSTYFYTSSALDLDLNLELQASHQKTQDLCQKPYENHPLKHLGQENVMNQCFRGVFMNTLLEVGYGFNTSQTRITMVQKVQGQVVDWTLGYLLDKFVDDIPIINDKKWIWHYCWWFQPVSLTFAGLTLLYIAYFGIKRLYRWYTNRGQVNLDDSRGSMISNPDDDCCVC